MKNLAGVDDCDVHIRTELEGAGIHIQEAAHRSKAEVSAKLTGTLGPYSETGKPAFSFWRAWYYWVVSGNVPLDVATKLYEDPEGRKSVRVRGHCGCPPPGDEWVTRTGEDGRKVVVLCDSDRDYFKRLDAGELDSVMAEVAAKTRMECVFVDTIEERDRLSVRSFITSYHIDTQEGLNLFVRTLRDHGLVTG